MFCVQFGHNPTASAKKGISKGKKKNIIERKQVSSQLDAKMDAQK